MKKVFLISFIFSSISIVSFAQTKKTGASKKTSLPTLCQCLTAKGGNPSMDKPKGCKEVILSRYGTTRPSMAQMRNDYYNCQ